MLAPEIKSAIIADLGTGKTYREIAGRYEGVTIGRVRYIAEVLGLSRRRGVKLGMTKAPTKKAALRLELHWSGFMPTEIASALDDKLHSVQQNLRRMAMDGYSLPENSRYEKYSPTVE